MKYIKFFLWFVLGLVLLASLTFIVVQKIERELVEIRVKKEEVRIKKPQEIKRDSANFLVLSQETIEDYGADIDLPDDDTIVLAVVKKDLESFTEEVIYRIKKKRMPETKMEFREKGVFIKRKLNADDNVLIDFSGNEIMLSEFDLYSGIFSNNQKFFVYLENNLDWKINFVDLEQQDIIVLPFDLPKESLPTLLGFDGSSKKFFFKYQDQGITRFAFYDLEREDFIEIEDDFNELFIGKENIYASRYEEASSLYYLDKLGVTAGSMLNTENILQDNQGVLSKVLEDQSKLYLQIEDTIFVFSNGELTPLISDAELLELISSDKLLYRKYSELNRVDGVFLFDIKNQTSKAIYQNRENTYGDSNYQKYDFLGLPKS